jgi:hypothetical protein
MKWVVIGIEVVFGMALGAAILGLSGLALCLVGPRLYALLKDARFTWPKLRSVDYLWLCLIALAFVGIVKIALS